MFYIVITMYHNSTVNFIPHCHFMKYYLMVLMMICTSLKDEVAFGTASDIIWKNIAASAVTI